MADHDTIEASSKTKKEIPSHRSTSSVTTFEHYLATEKIQLQTQEDFLKILCQQHIPVAIYLTSGIKLQGKIAGFDDYTVLLKGQTEQIVYKHAICSILPESK